MTGTDAFARHEVAHRLEDLQVVAAHHTPSLCSRVSGMPANPTTARFVHLNVRSDYSLLRSMLPIAKLARLAVDLDFPAMALTDINSLSGALGFSLAMWNAGVQPIAGITADTAFNDHQRAPLRQLILLAASEQGLGNLLRIGRAMHFLAGSHQAPCLTLAQLAAHADGILALTGGPHGPIDAALAEGNHRRAREHLSCLKDMFQDRLYVEIQRHGLDSQHHVEPLLLDLAHDMRLPIVATNACSFPSREDYPYHQYLLQIHALLYGNSGTPTTVTEEHFLKSADEMATVFADLAEALDNTIEIALRCGARFEGRKPILPSFLKHSGCAPAKPEPAQPDMLTIVIDGKLRIAEVRPLLEKFLVPSTRGERRVRILVEEGGEPEMELFLPGLYSLSPQDLAAIAAIPSISRVG